LPQPLNDASLVDCATQFHLMKGITLFKYDDWKLGTIWRVTRTWENSGLSLNKEGKWVTLFTEIMENLSFKDQYEAVSLLQKVLGHTIHLYQCADLWEFEHNLRIADMEHGFLLYQDTDDGYARGWNVNKDRWTSITRAMEVPLGKCSFQTLEAAWAKMTEQSDKMDKEKANGDHQRNSAGEHPGTAERDGDRSDGADSGATDA
jgi:hypothetical protein